MEDHTRLVDDVRRRQRKRPASLDAVDFLHVQPSPTVQVLRCVRKVVLEAKRVGDAVAFIP